MATDALDWVRLHAAYPTMLGECEAGVARWGFAPIDADWESPYALWEARRGSEPPSREVSRPDEPEGWEKVVQYGFDIDGTILVARRFSTIKGVPRVTEEVLWATVGGHRVHILRTYPPLQDVIISCAVPHREGEIVHGVETWSHEGHHTRESYTYGDGRLTRIALDDGELYRIGYDEDGTLAVIWAANPGRDEGREIVAYRRKGPGDVVKARREAEQLLCDGISAWARRQEVSGTVRVLVIGYDEPPNDVLPPPLGLGQTDDAVVAAVAGGEYLSAGLYSVADQGIFDPVPAELADDFEAFQRLNQEWASTHDPEAARRLLLAVAKRLNEQDWSELFAITEDFVVVPVDLELTELERNLRAVGVRK